MAAIGEARGFAIVVHGGAGHWPDADCAPALAGVRAALEAGLAVLAGGGSALDAVVAAVVALEDNPLFNAGTGSVLNLAGEVEMDASVMVGDALACGGVAALRRVKNPVLVARKVMETTGHVLLAGDGAQLFAREHGFSDFDPVTARRQEEHRKKIDGLSGHGSGGSASQRNLQQQAQSSKGTVGAVARDSRGVLAAATSTGGIALKLPGRVGDSPIPGAGNYANVHGAASATGNGETIIRFAATRAVCELIGAKRPVQQAVEEVLGPMRELGAEAGLIAVERGGAIGVAHTSPAMPHAFFSDEASEIISRMLVQER